MTGHGSPGGLLLEEVSSPERSLRSDGATPPKGGFLGPNLGRNAESHATLDSQGVFLGACTGEKDADQASLTAPSRARRWARKAQANALERKEGKRFERQLNCHRLRRKAAAGKLDRGRVDLRRSQLSQALYYANLQTCGSPWACPLCAAKITERRREELQEAVDYWLELGNTVALLSLTNSHHAGERLVDLMNAQAKALAWFLKHREVRRLLKACGVVGHVRSWEVTHGRFAFGHGWHPHFHLLLLIDLELARKGFGLEDGGVFSWDFFAKALKGPLYGLWLRACERAGLGKPSYERGLDVVADRGGGSGVYLAKMGLEEEARRWTFADEVTRGQTKKASSGKGETPFELLDSMLEDPEDSQGGWLFIEYAGATKGRAQVAWSRGLRKRLELAEVKSDAEIAEEVREDDPIWAHLTLAQWRSVVKSGAEWQLLRTGETEGLDGVLRLLNRLQVDHEQAGA